MGASRKKKFLEATTGNFLEESVSTSEGFQAGVALFGSINNKHIANISSVRSKRAEIFLGVGVCVIGK